VLWATWPQRADAVSVGTDNSVDSHSNRKQHQRNTEVSNSVVATGNKFTARACWHFASIKDFEQLFTAPV
jgi:hypothetical protein